MKYVVVCVVFILLVSCGTFIPQPWDAKTGYTISQVDHDTYVVTLTEFIGHASQYVLLEQFLKARAGHEVVIFKLKGRGGYVSGGKVIIRGLQTTKARLVVHVTGNVYSMHADLVCFFPKIELAPHVVLMYHAVQRTTVFTDWASQKWARDLLMTYCPDIVSREQIQFIFDNPKKAVYIKARDITSPRVRLL